MKSKGQMFLIGAVIIVSSLAVIKANTMSSSARYELEKLESTLEGEIFKNLVSELNNTVIYSSNSPQMIDMNVFEFMNFTQSKSYGRAMELNALYVGIISNSTIDRMNVSVINMLGNEMDVDLSIPGQSFSNNDMPDRSKWDTNFTITSGNNYNVTVVYNLTEGFSVNKTIYVDTKSNRDVYVNFVYIALESEDALHVQEYQKTIKISKK